MKRVKALSESGILTDSVSEAIENETIEQKGEFFDMLLGTWAASVIGNMLASKFKIPGQGIIRAGIGAIRAGQIL